MNIEETEQNADAKLLPVFYECEICGQKYSRKKTLEYHQISFHDKIVDPKFVRTDEEKRRLVTLAMTTYPERICALCNRKFSSVTHLRRHLVHAHELRVERKPRAGKEGKIRNYECQFCGRRFITPNALREHLIKSHDMKAPLPSSLLLSVSQKRAAANANQLTVKNKCHECGLEFSLKQTLQSHMHSSHGAEPPQLTEKSKRRKRANTCPICSSQYSNRTDLTRHIERVHRAVAEEYTEKEKGEETLQAPVETKFPCHLAT